MKNTKKAFTLVEIIISTIILTTGVFAIYSLLTINSNNLNNYDTLITSKDLFENMQECIKKIGIAGFSSSQTGYSFNFGTDNNSCLTGSYNTSLSFSGVKLDNKEYFLYGITDSSKQNWQLFIEESSIVKQEKSFILRN
ncbi:MAG: hypothetical protein PHR68_03860 [Candidatus Gracilibacteria bacterium]|nr:hypothetical protein [Candidatus Gracilibacteria bacterium]